MTAYYNEFDPFAAAWLRELIADGVIAPGDVDTRSITEVQPDDLRGYTQCHFFAGIGGWSYAARLAGLPDDFPLWTGSCPCQPFSAAGKQQGEADHRHLWPEFRRLIAKCRPAIAVGEQVASALGRDWLTGVRADLEELGYAVGAADLCAASAGAPHIRQRLFWVADTRCISRTGWGITGVLDGKESSAESTTQEREWLRNATHDGGATSGVADTEHAERGTLRFNGTNGRDGTNDRRTQAHSIIGTRGQVRGVGDSTLGGLGIHGGTPGRPGHPDQPIPVGGVEHALREGRAGESLGLLGASNQGYWADYTLLPCRDGKTRRTQSGLFPLVDGPPRGVGPGGDPRRPIPPDEANATAEARVNRLRGYGNAIVPQVAALFLRAYLES